jgi:spore germination protein GerM
MISNTSRHRRVRWTLWILGLVAVLAIGLWLRSLSPTTSTLALANWWPWTRATTVTLYFADGQFLFPVSRRMPANDALPHAVLQTLLAGPRVGTGLKNPIPQGVEIRSIQLAGGVAHIDLSTAFLDNDSQASAAEASVVRTMTSLPGVNSVVLSVEGTTLAGGATRVPLLYYPSANGLVALRASSESPGQALTEYLSGPEDPELTGLPRDARLLTYDYDPGDGLLSLNFAYSPSVRSLALDRPERMRLLLLGLITTLTEFSEVRAVQLDFEGQTRLGLGQCSDLLRTPQPRPQLLNDERLLEQ